jgi:deoxyribodipyrimidine photolyase-related protein
MAKHLHVVLGNQLFPVTNEPIPRDALVFMAEDSGLCTHFKYHKHKIIFFLAAMRHYADELKDRKIKVDYHRLEKKNLKKTYEQKLEESLKKHSIKTASIYEIEDKFFEKRVVQFFKKKGIDLEIIESPGFMVSRQKFQDYNESVKRPFMKTFYERLRKETGILMDKGKPTGGKFSFDADNRKSFPKDEKVPELTHFSRSDHAESVIELVNEVFADHPGQTDDFWLAVTRKQALHSLRKFISYKIKKFGDYQDAIVQNENFLYHSVLSPYINAGMITPHEIADTITSEFKKKKLPINSVEGYLRQLIGWREFVRGIYQCYSEKQDKDNFFKHKRKLNSHWYKANTGVPILDDAIRRAVKYSYSHHIERLMVLSNFMLMCEIDPKEVHRWFMEMYADSSDWVMGPNVYGMGQFSDGGVFATKPYICSSNYLLKMSNFKKGDWCDVADGLFWRFMDKKRKFFEKQPRMNTLLRSLDKMKDERKKRIFKAADDFIKKVTK